MSYRELTMVDVKEVLRRGRAGQGIRRIARETGMDRKTVRGYLERAQALELLTPGEVTDEQVGQVAERLQARPGVERSDAWEQLPKHKELLEKWLKRSKPLRLRKAHELLVRRGVQVSYWLLRRFVIEQLGWKERDVTVLLEDPDPGQEAQVDFGQMGRIPDEQTGKLRVLWALIVTLSFSRYQFVWPTFFQTTEAVCEGLDAAWQFFGGCPVSIIPDNTKAMVIWPDPLKPRLTEAFGDYAQARGVYVDPARIRHPKDKPKVENQVQFVRNNWFAGEEFRGLQDARDLARWWCADKAGMRVHGTTCQVPRHVYEQQEKATMKPPPADMFDVPQYGTAKVQRDCHIRVERALYSVSYRLAGKDIELRTRADKSTVKAYLGARLIKVHPRQPAGGRSTDPSDYPPGKALYARRSVSEQLEQARQLGEHIGRYAELLADCPLPWTMMRQVHALLGLCERFGAGRVEAICQSALTFEVVDVTRIRKMLERAAKPVDAASTGGKVVKLTPAARFARSADQFETRKAPGGKEVL